MYRNGFTDGLVGTKAFVIQLGEQLVVEQSPPQQHFLTGEIAVDFVLGAMHGESGIAADLAAFRFTCEGAEALPGTWFEFLSLAVGRASPHRGHDFAISLGSLLGQ